MGRRLVESGKLTLDGLHPVELAYGVTPIVGLIMAAIRQDFHVSPSDAPARLVAAIRGAAVLSPSGSADIVLTDLAVRTAVGRHTAARHPFNYSELTEAIAFTIITMDGTNPVAMLPAAKDEWAAAADAALAVMERRNEDVELVFTKEEFERLTDCLQGTARTVNGILNRRELAGHM